MSDKIREAFAARFQAPIIARWNVDKQCYYTVHGDAPRRRVIEMYNARWEAWQAALAQQPAPAAPDGWKLVPVEPTEQMLATTSWPGCAKNDYEKMLSAAPAAPVAVQEPVAWMRKWALNGEKPVKVKSEKGRMVTPFKFKFCELTTVKCLPDDVPLYAAPPAAEQPGAVSVSRQVLADMAQDAEDYGAQLLANRLRALCTGGEA